MKGRKPHQETRFLAAGKISGRCQHFLGRQTHLRNAGAHFCLRLRRHQFAHMLDGIVFRYQVIHLVLCEERDFQAR